MANAAAPAAPPAKKRKFFKEIAVINADNCTGCDACVEVCPVDCIYKVPGEDLPHLQAFCDIDIDTFCMTAETVAEALTPATRAVIPVHLFGMPAPMDDLARLAKERDLALIEDAAQAAGARLNGARVGALGDVATFSFFPSKNLFCLGDGGAIVTGDDFCVWH